MRGLVCRRATCTPCTTRRLSSGKTRSTSPRLPLSRPLITTTLSPLLIFNFGIVAASQNLGGERDDLHEPAGAQISRHPAEEAGADRLPPPAGQHPPLAGGKER